MVMMGKDCLGFDQYHRKRKILEDWAGVSRIGEPLEPKALATALGTMSGFPKHPASVDAAWGVEYRVVEHEGSLLIPLINHLKKPLEISVKVEGAGESASAPPV